MKRHSRQLGVLWALVFCLVAPVAGGKPRISFLEKNLQLKTQLVQWEKEAPEEIQKEVKILRTGDAVAKGYAAARLGGMGGQAKGATLALVETFKDATVLQWVPGGGATSPRKEAAKALGRIGKTGVELLIEALKDQDQGFRSAAASGLGEIGKTKAVVPWLQRISMTRAAVAEPLIQALKDKDWPVREAAASALGEVGGEAAVEPLIQALKDKDWPVREAAASALGRIGDKKTIEPLIQALKDEAKAVRSAAASGLGKVGDKMALEPLVGALTDESLQVREAAAAALGEIGDKTAVEPLIEVLKDGRLYVQQAAADALRRIGDKRAVEPLIQTLKDSDGRAREAAAWALREIDPAWAKSEMAQRAVPSFIQALTDRSSGVRSGAAFALGEVGDRTAVGPLIGTLKDEDYSTRFAVAGALDKIDRYWAKSEMAQRAIPSFVQALTDENPRVRSGAVFALDRLGDKTVVKPLIDALKDRDRLVQQEATQALMKITGQNLGTSYAKWQKWWQSQQQ